MCPGFSDDIEGLKREQLASCWITPPSRPHRTPDAFWANLFDFCPFLFTQSDRCAFPFGSSSSSSSHLSKALSHIHVLTNRVWGLVSGCLTADIEQEFDAWAKCSFFFFLILAKEKYGLCLVFSFLFILSFGIPQWDPVIVNLHID